jgi:hypothetical protein
LPVEADSDFAEEAKPARPRAELASDKDLRPPASGDCGGDRHGTRKNVNRAVGRDTREEAVRREATKAQVVVQ